jgi:hypothetical protein
MRFRGKSIACAVLLGSLTAGTVSAVVDASNPYYKIIDRNPFGLNPPPTNTPPPPPPPPPSNLKLTGISGQTVLESKRVFLIVTEPGGKTANKMLREGERDGALEVVAIDEQAGSVKVINAGVPSTITFETHGNKAAAVPIPGTPGVPPPGIGMPPAQPHPTLGIVQPPANAFGTATSTGVPAGIGGNPVGIGGAPGFPSGIGGDPNAARTIPTRAVRVAPITPQSQAAQPGVYQPPQPAQQSPTSVEEQVLMMQLNEIINNSQGGGPPMPKFPEGYDPDQFRQPR